MNIDSLAPLQQAFLEAAVTNQKLVDLGGYNGSLALWLLKQGAKSVLVVDKEKVKPRARHPGLTYYHGLFEEFLPHAGGFDAAVLSWPVNYEAASQSLILLLLRVPRIIYIGSNSMPNMCGTPSLWKYLTVRKLEAVVPGRPHNLIIYGDHGRDKTVQPLVEEEINGLHSEDVIVDAKAVCKMNVE